MAQQQEETSELASEANQKSSVDKVTERIKDIYKGLDGFEFKANYDGLGRMTQHCLSQPRSRPVYEIKDTNLKQLLKKICWDIKLLEIELNLKEIWKGITHNGAKLWATEDSVSHQATSYKVVDINVITGQTTDYYAVVDITVKSE